MIQSHFVVLFLLLIVSEITELQTEWIIQATGVLRFQTKNISLSWEFISYCKALFFPGYVLK